MIQRSARPLAAGTGAWRVRSSPGARCFRIAGLLLASALAPIAGFEVFQQTAAEAQPTPMIAALATPMPYGSFGGPGSPYGAASRPVTAPGGAFSDQQPGSWPSNLPDYNPADLNGGERGFAPSQLTVNTTLSGH